MWLNDECMGEVTIVPGREGNECAPVAEPEAAAEDAPNPKLPKLAPDCPEAAAGWPRKGAGVALDTAGCPNAGAAWPTVGADCPNVGAGVDCPDDDAILNVAAD